MPNPRTPASDVFRARIQAQMSLLARDASGYVAPSAVSVTAPAPSPVGPYTTDERKLLRRWEGLKTAVLEQLSGLDTDAIRRGDRFTETRRVLIAERGAVIEVRARLGVDERSRLPRLRRDEE